MENLYALIMAGGGGTRMWPTSRSARPKQFTQLLRERSLVQIAFDRITPLVPPERVLVVTGERYAALIAEQLPDLPAENIIAEPAGRNTAPAIGLGAIHLRRRDPHAVMAVLTADHIMHREEIFRQAIRAAAQAAAGGPIVTLGITPAGPETGYGYIERAEGCDEAGLYPVLSFREKPDRDTAESMVASGRFYWNSGMFVWRVDTILREIQKQLPELHQALEAIAESLGTPQETARTRQIWQDIRPISIDFGVMEKARDVLVLPVDPAWKDVGSWSAVYDVSLADGSQDAPDGNVVLRGQHLALDTTGCLVLGDKLIATIGLRDLIIVESDDAILICPRDQAQQVRALVEQLKAQGLQAYL